MKHSFQTVILTLLFACLLFYSCKKEISCDGCQADPPTCNINKPPVAIAGPDRAITLPTDSILLDGSASNDPGGRITAWQWTKISGPSSFNIVNANSVQAQATDLAEGVYQFELTVTNSLGLFDKDTTTVTVNNSNANEIIFYDLIWQCWWGCWVEITNPYSHLPAGITTFRVFIKRDNTNTWEEAIFGSQTSNYGFLADSSSLVVYMAGTTNIDNDTPDVKILY